MSSVGFAVLTPDTVIVYSFATQKVKELPLSLGREAQVMSFTPYASPTGKYAVISYSLLNGGTFYLWMDLPDLKVLKKWPLLAAWTTGWVSDNGLAINIHGAAGATSGSIGSPGERSSDFPCPPATKACAGDLLLLNSSFVNNQTLFSTTPPNRVRRFAIWLIRTDGTVILDDELPEGEVTRPFYPVVGGRRFAIAVYKGHGGSTFLDVAPHFDLKEIRVYDSESGRQLYSLDGRSQKIKSMSAFALSGDGSLLGLIDQDGILRVYEIPQSN